MIAQQPLYASARKRNSVPKRGTNLLHHRHGEPIATSAFHDELESTDG